MPDGTCSSCNAPVDPAAAFCAACGANTRIPSSNPTGDDDTVVQAASLAPEQVGRYKILQLLGEGGMGEVYLAEQTEPVKRRVALKIIKLGMDTKEIVARFESERQALAVMDHPHISRVYDAGASENGRPYFVMELVSGVSLTDYCDTHKLSTLERLHLFIGVCEAILHAHQKGVVHRDLKPSNILVTVQEGKPIPKIIDFGIAKAMGQRLTDRTFVTSVGLPIGTPAYMSPEQAEMSGLDVDTRTDIYALGVILYELLAGTLPFDAASTVDFVAFQEQLRLTDAPRPSTRMDSLGDQLSTVAELRQTNPASLRVQLKGDLDWIILKAMEKDRTRRYETVNALIRDLHRHLNHMPVTARSPTASYRLKKFVRRHRVGVIASTVVLIGLGVGLVTATYEWRQAEVARARALQNLNLGIEAVDEMLVRVGDTLAFANVPQLEELRGELFERARHFYEQFEDQTTEPEYRLATALASLRIADVYQLTGQGEAAEASYVRAIEGLTKLTDDFPDRPQYKDHLALGYDWLGLHLAAGDPRQAREAYDTALGLQRELITTVPDESEYKHHLSRTLYNRGILLSADTASATEAEEDYQAAIETLELLIGSNRGSDGPVDAYRQELARSYNNLANLMGNLGRESEASTYYDRAIMALEELRDGAPNNRTYKQELAIYNNNLANLLLDYEEPRLAEDRNRRALELWEELAAPLPSLDLERANAYNTLGIILQDIGSAGEAEQALRASLEIWERLDAAPDDLSDPTVFRYRFGFTLFDLAILRLDASDVSGAGQLLSRAVDQHTRVLRSIESGSAMFDLCLEYEDLAARVASSSESLTGVISRALRACERG